MMNAMMTTVMMVTSPIRPGDNDSLPRRSEGKGLLGSRHCGGKLEQGFL